MKEKEKVKAAVVAFGGNALMGEDGNSTYAEQIIKTDIMSNKLLFLFDMGYRILITHGNGPQVGNFLMQQECLAENVPPMPLEACNAMTQGQIGYMIGHSLRNTFTKKNIKKPIIVFITQVVVSEDDPAFERAIVFLQRCQNRTESNDMPTSGNDNGAFYAPKKSKDGTVTLPDGTEVYKSYGSMTYALLKSYLFCGLPADDARVQAAYKWITENYSVDENPGVGQEGLFYYYLGMARALTALGEDTIKTPDGRVHNWREELSAKIISIQKDDGSWTNPSDRWMEGDPALVCGYAVTVLNHCYPQ